MKVRHPLLIMLVGILWIAPHTILAQQNYSGFIHGIDWSEDGSRLAVTTRAGLTIYDADLTTIAAQDFPDDINFVVPDIKLSPDGEYLYTGVIAVPHELIAPRNLILHSATLQPHTDFSSAEVLPYTAQWSNDGTKLAFRTRSDRETEVYSTATGELLKSFSSKGWLVPFEGGVKWSPDNQYFARASGNFVFIVDGYSGDIAAEYQITEVDYIDDIVWSSDSTRVALATTTHVDSGSPGSVPDFGSPDTDYLKSVMVMDISNSSIAPTMTGLPGSASRLVWSPDGQQLAADMSNGAIFVWNPDTGVLVDSYQTAPYRTIALAYSPYGGRLLIGYNTNEPSTIDKSFTPISTFGQTNLNGIIQFVAPAASSDKLQTIMPKCVTDTSLLATGNTLLAVEHIVEFEQWLNQLPAAAISDICRGDLELITEAVIVQRCNIVSVSAVDLISGIPRANNVGIPQTTCPAENTSIQKNVYPHH
jgi:WD40 repeat protein